MVRPVRIAFLSEHASPIALLGGADAGGQNVYVDEVSRNLARCGYNVDVFTRRESEDTPEIVEWAAGVRVIHLGAGPAQRIAKDELWPYMPEFRDAFLNFMIHDEVHYDLLHSNFWMSGWVATELKQRLNIPAVQIFHALGKTKRRHQKHHDTSPADRIKVESAVVEGVDKLIAQCPNERRELVYDYHASANKVVMIPAAVNTTIFHPVPQDQARQKIALGLGQDDFVIVYVGRMLPRKDIRNVVRALALLVEQVQREHEVLPRPIKLLIVGGETVEPDAQATPEIGELQRLAEQLGVTPYIEFVGKRQQDMLCDYYSAGDVAVTTPWYEPFGLTPLESMACARPVIGSAVGGLTYTIADGETGFLVPARDPQQLALRLKQFYMQPSLSGRMGQVARLRVEQEFTWPVVALRTASLYESLLASYSQHTHRSWSLPPSLVVSIDSQAVAGE